MKNIPTFEQFLNESKVSDAMMSAIENWYLTKDAKEKKGIIGYLTKFVELSVQKIEKILKSENNPISAMEIMTSVSESLKLNEDKPFTTDKILNDFLNKIAEKGNLYINPINPRELVFDDELILQFDRFDKKSRKEINLGDMMVINKRKGFGKKMMQIIVDTADELKYDLTLYAKPFGLDAMPKDKLIKFYKSYGFDTIPDQYGMIVKKDIEDYVLSEPSEGLDMIRRHK